MDGWMDGEAAGQMSLFIRIAGINYSRGFEGAAQERGGRRWFHLPQRETKKNGQMDVGGEKNPNCDYGESEQDEETSGC